MRLLKQKWIRYFAFVLFASVSTSVFALPKNEIETIYYSDASKKGDIAGFTLFTCSGRFHRYGKTTPYYIRSSEPCNIRPKSPGVPCEFTTNPHCQNLPTPRPNDGLD